MFLVFQDVLKQLARGMVPGLETQGDTRPEQYQGTDLKGESPWPHGTPFGSQQVVYDLVYAPTWTPFLEHARTSGALPLSGIGMLVRQAALAFSIWTEVEAPLHVMELAVKGLWSEGAA